jgi:2-phosphosulfolactate phosphatase
VIDIALTPAELRPAGTAVVIDVLRATSTATQALAAGYKRVLCVDSVERASELRAPGRVLAGERNCLMPADFDQGNSPQAALRVRGAELVLATTNGAPAIVAAAARAPVVLIASLLNLRAAVEQLRAAGGDVQIVCSGTDGAVALEDVYVAGRISSQLSGPRTDAALVAEAVVRGHATAVDALAASSDAARLREVGLDDDIKYCARESRIDTVPRVILASGGIAVLAAAADAPGVPWGPDPFHTDTVPA